MTTTKNHGLILLLFIVLFVVLSLFVMPISAQEISMEAMEAGKKGLESFLKSIPIEDLKHFNFSDQDELDHAVLGNPFRVYTVEPEAILNYSSETPIEDIIHPTYMLFFPVNSKGEARTLLTVDLVGGEWRAIGIGSSKLARQWATILENWPSSEGYEHTFVRIFQAKADFVFLYHLGEPKMIPLKSGLISLGLTKGVSGGGVYNPSDIIFSLQKPVRENIKSSW